MLVVIANAKPTDNTADDTAVEKEFEQIGGSYDSFCRLVVAN